MKRRNAAASNPCTPSAAEVSRSPPRCAIAINAEYTDSTNTHSSMEPSWFPQAPVNL